MLSKKVHNFMLVNEKEKRRYLEIGFYYRFSISFLLYNE
jgi:hypothetical protein